MFTQIGQRLFRYRKGQQGQVLIVALIFLALAALLLPPLLSLVASGLKQGSIIEDRTIQLYAADAGFQSAWQKIHKGSFDPPPTTYPVSNLGSGLAVDVTLTLLSEDPDTGEKTYLVHSVATTASGNSTSIDAQLIAQKGNFNYFLDNIFTTGGTLGLKNNVDINGFAQDAGQDFAGTGPNWGINPSPPPQLYGDRLVEPVYWPTADELRAFYANQSPIYHNSGWVISSGTTILDKTEYVRGAFSMDNAILNLNGQTLFVDGNVLVDIHSTVVVGPGAIVATGNIAYKPNSVTGGPAQGVLLFALGYIDFEPGGSYYGWVAAKGEELYQGDALYAKLGNAPSYNWLEGNIGLNFPGIGDSGGPGSGAGLITILTWKIGNQ